MVGSVVEWLERRDCDQHNLSSKPIHAIILCPGEIHGTFHCLAVLVRSSKIQSYLFKTNKKKIQFLLDSCILGSLEARQVYGLPYL